MAEQPLVSVVTPVYNGARYLDECIESVLSQDYENLEHVILDNASTDATPGILGEFARRDPRIRVFRNPETLWVIDNWNRALELISPHSRYCRILHADDAIYPDAIAAAVALAEGSPSVGIVGGLRLRGDHVECRGLPSTRSVFSGAEVIRPFLKGEIYALAPTSMLVRSDLVRARQPFYPRQYLHADLAACFEILAQHDYGFVHQVLSFSRKHADSITTTVAQRKQTIRREGLLMLQQYGPRFFPLDELAEIERATLRRYYRLLVRSFVTGRGREFLSYHIDGLRDANRLPSILDLLVALAGELAESAVAPGKVIRHLRARLRH
ncbi:MAG: glycosyltransferase [Alphaproteobacteria bacterium]|nr:glycosyltransferase [Alphaproteobacteria bacterium]